MSKVISIGKAYDVCDLLASDFREGKQFLPPARGHIKQEAIEPGR